MGLRALVYEVRSVAQAIREEQSPRLVGPVVVSGMLAEQLAKELAADAEPGTVVAVGDSGFPSAEVLVRIVAGVPTETDELVVRTADRRGIPVVVVQLWPQEDPTPPFVLTPFVVECRAGAGFPVGEIADRIVEAMEDGLALAARVPTLTAAARYSVVRQAVLRSAVLAVAFAGGGSSRPALALEQIRMLARLRTTAAASDEAPVIAGTAAITLAAGFAFRDVARRARQVLPAPIAEGVVAVGGTWALARALELVEARARL